MQEGKISVNNQAIKQKVCPPTKAEILHLNEAELEAIFAIKLVTVPNPLEKGSE